MDNGSLELTLICPGVLITTILPPVGTTKLAISGHPSRSAGEPPKKRGTPEPNGFMSLTLGIISATPPPNPRVKPCCPCRFLTCPKRAICVRPPGRESHWPEPACCLRCDGNHVDCQRNHSNGDLVTRSASSILSGLPSNITLPMGARTIAP